MKCPKCGNDLEPGEAFCGQCGTSTVPLGQTPEMAQAPYNGQANNPYVTNIANSNFSPIPPAGPYNTNVMPPSSSYPPGALITPNQTPVRPSTPLQQPGFYQDATESISAFSPQASSYPPGSQQGNVGTPPMPVNPQYVPQGQGQGRNYTQHPYPPPTSGQGYNYGGPPGSTPQPGRQRTNPILIFVCVLLALAIIAVVALGAVYVLNRHSPSPRVQSTPTVSITPTSAPTPTAVPSPTVTPSPTPSPAPTITPTATPFANFSWCSTVCTTDGFLVQYPMTWLESQLTATTGVEFLNPAQQDEYAIFKTPGLTTSSAGDLINSDLQTNYAGYTSTTPTSVITIDGETWTSAVAYSQAQPPNTKERVEIIATVHGGKGYIIELQAPDAMFENARMQYFNTIIDSFQFFPATS